jgi:hypothetical protein
MANKQEPRTGVRLGSENFIRTPSDAIKSVDYSRISKVLEIEWQGSDDDNKIYHYLNVSKKIYEQIVTLKNIIDSLPKPLEKSLKARYSIQNFFTRNVRDQYDYYELHVLNEHI